MTRKKICSLLLIIPIFWAGAALAAAQPYQLLVPIPGLSKTAGTSIGDYLQSMYFFLMGIIGLVALAYMIMGGIQYITAGGNTAKVGAAKETIKSAISGLLLGILSWVILVTINPDLQFIKQPGVAFKELAYETALSGCARNYDAATQTCWCQGTTDPQGTKSAVTGIASKKDCDDECKKENLCGDGDTACIKAGSVIDANSPGYDSDKGCTCLDGTSVLLKAGVSAETKKDYTCSQTCMEAKKCGFKFLVLKLNQHNTPTGGKEGSVEAYYGLKDNAMWNMNLTNDGSFGDFNVTSKYRAGMKDAKGVADEKFDCAMLVTNEVSGWAIEDKRDKNYIYWVHEGQVISADNSMSMYRQMMKPDGSANFSGCCGDGADCSLDSAVFSGVCDEKGARMVLQTQYGDSVRDSCDDCSFATWKGNKPIWRPLNNIVCSNGYWR